MAAPAGDSARFADLLGQEERIYTEVLELSRHQSEVVESGDSEGLLKVLAAKGELVAQLESLGGELGPLKEGWKECRESLAEAERVEIEKRLESISALLEQIIAEDSAVEEMVGRKRDEGLDRIKKVQMGRKMNKAYGDGPKGGGRFTDSKR